MRARLTAVLCASALILAACGDDDSESASGSDEETEQAATPETAIEEIGEVRTGLDEALTAYEGGDAEAAEEAATDAYLEHFELVEGPLEEVDEELNEELEEQIREELNAAITSDAPVADVEALVEEANAGLDEAEAALEGAE